MTKKKQFPISRTLVHGICIMCSNVFRGTPVNVKHRPVSLSLLHLQCITIILVIFFKHNLRAADPALHIEIQGLLKYTSMHNEDSPVKMTSCFSVVIISNTYRVETLALEKANSAINNVQPNPHNIISSDNNNTYLFTSSDHNSNGIVHRDVLLSPHCGGKEVLLLLTFYPTATERFKELIGEFARKVYYGFESNEIKIVANTISNVYYPINWISLYSPNYTIVTMPNDNNLKQKIFLPPAYTNGYKCGQINIRAHTNWLNETYVKESSYQCFIFKDNGKSSNDLDLVEEVQISVTNIQKPLIDSGIHPEILGKIAVADYRFTNMQTPVLYYEVTNVPFLDENDSRLQKLLLEAENKLGTTNANVAKRNNAVRYIMTIMVLVTILPIALAIRQKVTKQKNRQRT